jgi:hypothetical protein
MTEYEARAAEKISALRKKEMSSSSQLKHPATKPPPRS